MVHENVQALFASVFDEKVDLDTTTSNLKTWDSLGHANLIIALEKEFNVKLTYAEIVNLISVKKIQDFLREKTLL